jgi:NADH-quinone oxidoreductase subunit M
MLTHGIVSSAMFLLVGSLYDRFHSKILHYFGGLVQIMPIFSIFFFFFSISNFSFPGTASFIGELLLLVGIIKKNVFIFLVSTIGILLGTCFSIYLVNRLIFGTLKTVYQGITLIDLTKRETYVLFILLILNILLGIFPNIILDGSYVTIKSLLLTVLL